MHRWPKTLHYAHGKGVVHRDIKPSNIILQTDGQIKITDFGIAHIEDSTATLQTQAGEIMGTPAYMSPEQVLGKPVDGRSDIFSLGVVLYELSTGKRPFGGAGKNLATIFNEIIQQNPTEPAQAIEGGTVPPGLSRAIMKCLDKSLDGRFQTGKDLAQVLRGRLDASGDKMMPPPQADGAEPAREVPPQAAPKAEEAGITPPPIVTEQNVSAPYTPPATPGTCEEEREPHGYGAHRLPGHNRPGGSRSRRNRDLLQLLCQRKKPARSSWCSGDGRDDGGAQDP